MTAAHPWHLNDMVIDSTGRTYVGNFGFDLMGGDGMVTANLVRVDPDGAMEALGAGLLAPDG